MRTLSTTEMTVVSGGTPEDALLLISTIIVAAVLFDLTPPYTYYYEPTSYTYYPNAYCYDPYYDRYYYC